MTYRIRLSTLFTLVRLAITAVLLVAVSRETGFWTAITLGLLVLTVELVGFIIRLLTAEVQLLKGRDGQRASELAGLEGKTDGLGLALQGTAAILLRTHRPSRAYDAMDESNVREGLRQAGYKTH